MFSAIFGDFQRLLGEMSNSEDENVQLSSRLHDAQILQDHWASLYETQELADLVIKCKDGYELRHGLTDWPRKRPF